MSMISSGLICLLRLDSSVQSTFIQSEWCEQKVAFDAIRASFIPLADLALI